MGRPRKNPGGVTLPEGQITVDRVRRPTLADKRFDPFEKFKTEPDKFHYRALNSKAHNISKKEAQGYETIGGSQFGDLVLGRIPKDIRQANERYALEKDPKQRAAAREL
jgi:hypothetical protein